MMFTIILSDEAKKQLIEWKKSGAKKDIEKILVLFSELELHPTYGTGQVEKLKGNYSGCWSRRINKQYRLIYRIVESALVVEVISLRNHYGQK